MYVLGKRRGQSVPWLLESLENMSDCGSGQWHGTDCPPKPEGKKTTHTHSHPNNYTFSGAAFLGFLEGLQSRSHA